MNDNVKALELAVAQIERQFGKGSIIRMGNDKVEPCAVIPTRALTLDRALGIGGLPRGRIVEIYGPEGAGKTTLALTVVAEAQRMGGKAAYIDAEHALDPTYMRALGVDLDELYLSQPSSGESSLQIVDMLAKSAGFSVIVIDSVAALTPKDELEEDIGKPFMAVQARMMSQAMRKLPDSADRSGTLLIFINQLRSKMVMMGNPETTPGGKALDYAASVRLDIRRARRPGATTDIIQDTTGNPVGITVRARVVKNRMAPPLKEAYFDILFGTGINEFKCLVETATDLGIIHKGGAGWYTVKDQKIQGLDSLMEHLASDLDLRDEIQKKTYDAINR